MVPPLACPHLPLDASAAGPSMEQGWRDSNPRHTVLGAPTIQGSCTTQRRPLLYQLSYTPKMFRHYSLFKKRVPTVGVEPTTSRF